MRYTKSNNMASRFSYCFHSDFRITFNYKVWKQKRAKIIVFCFLNLLTLKKVKPPIIKIIYSKFSNDILKIKHLKRPPNLNFLYLHVTIKLLNEFCLWKLHKSWEFLQDTEKGIKKMLIFWEEKGQGVSTFTKKCSKSIDTTFAIIQHFLTYSSWPPSLLNLAC